MSACRMVSVGLILLTASACALTSNQRVAAARFAQASRDIGDFAANEFTHLRTATVEMNTTNVAIGGTADKSNLDETFDVDRVAVRVTAAKALSDYGQLLWALVSETQQAELNQASGKFVDSLRSVSGRKLSDAQLEGIGKAVQRIGRWWIESEKADAVKRIVPIVAPDVNRLCDLLIADFSASSLRLGQGFETTIIRLRTDADIALSDPATRYSDRMIAMRGQQMAERETQRLRVVSQEAARSLTTLKSANAELVRAIVDDTASIEDIHRVASEIRSLKLALDVVEGTR